MKPREDKTGIVDSTAALALLTGRPNYQVVVRDIGLFEWLPTGTPDGTDVFAGSIGYWSKVFSGGVSTPQLETPELTLTVISDTQINATWLAVTDAANYQLYRATTSDFSDETLVYDGALLLFNSTGLTASTPYYFRLKARGYERMNSAFDSDTATTDAYVPAMLTANRIAEFMMDEDAGQRLFNTVGGNTSNNNLIWFGEQHWSNVSNYFNSTSYFQKSETTITENYANNVLGKAQALRVVTLSGSTESGVTGAYAGMRIYRLLPAGTYTMSLAVKSNTGSAQSMRMLCNGGTISGDLAVTTAWTRVSYTITHPGGTPLLYFCINGSAGDPMDILIDQVKIEAGSSATAYVTPQFDANFGVDGTTEASDPTWDAGKGILVTDVQNAHIYTDTPATVTNISVHVAATVDASSTSQNYLYSTVFGDAGFDLMAGTGGTADTLVLSRFKFRNTSALIKLSKFADGQTHLFSGVYDGTYVRLYVDAVEQAKTAATLTSTSINRMLLNYTPIIGGTGSNGRIEYAAAFSVGHSAAEVLQHYQAVKVELASRGITMAANSIAIAVEGDSITIDVNTYARKAIRNMVPLIAENFAVVGSTVTGATSLDARKATVKAWLNASTAITKVLSVFIGANDLVTGVPATVLANLKAYCLEMKTDVPGLLINVCSVLPNLTGSQITNRNIFNPLLVADTSFYDVLTPFHLNSQMGADADASDIAKYPDGVHPSNAGHGYLYPDWQTAIETLL